jgi:DNA-binding transcriptional regulator YhcF (GntR family)
MINIHFQEHNAIPKYRQIIMAIEEHITAGNLKKGDKIPSLNMLCKQYNLSQDTVMMAYNDLKSKGIITSQVGKGYYVQSEITGYKHKILLLFDKLTAYKEDLYDAFSQAIKKDGNEQIFFHNNNLSIFQSILEGAAGEYTAYVIMPIDHPEAREIIGRLPSGKVFILDQGRKQYKNSFPYICQDFERDIYRILKENLSLVNKYHRLVLSIRDQKSHYRDIANGFRDFCKMHSIKYIVANDVKSIEIHERDAFIVVDDRDLEYLLRYAKENNFKPGKQIGIISYNETPLKALIASGITTISTDFAEMGKQMAEMVLNNRKLKIDNPFIMNIRNSF